MRVAPGDPVGPFPLCRGQGWAGQARGRRGSSLYSRDLNVGPRRSLVRNGLLLDSRGNSLRAILSLVFSNNSSLIIVLNITSFPYL